MTMTKKQAIEILRLENAADATGSTAKRNARAELLEALGRAGAFPSEENAAEIDACARELLRHDRATTVAGLALRLASACRAAGLVSK